MNKILFGFIAIAMGFQLISCEKDDKRTKDEYYFPILNPDDFIDSITNIYLPFTPGKVNTYEGQTDEGTETIVVTVTNDKKTILGIDCIVVHDVVSLEGNTTEDTYDWYAQDIHGNVWYLGEDSKEIENGVVVGTGGSWEAGVDGAQAGIVMPAVPILGVPYRQEYYFNEAEDWGKVIETGLNVKINYGTFTNCIKTEEWNPLEPDVLENKYYAPGIGVIKEETVKGEKEVVELINIQ
jgi:hypothetical protein